MRTVLGTVLALVAALLPVVARADETAPAAVPYSVEFLVPSADEPLEGWALEKAAAAPAGAPTESALTALAEPLGLDEDTFYVEFRVFKGTVGTVAVALIDVDAKAGDFRQALDAKATEAAWKVSELGSPTRLLVLAGPDAACQRLGKQFEEHTVYALSEMGMNRLRGRSGFQEEGRAAALQYTDAIQRLAGASGTAHAVRGVVHWIEAQPKKRGEKTDAAEMDAAAAEFAKSIAPGVAYPPKGSVRVFVAGELGGILLEKKDKAVLDRATVALELAVEHEVDGKDNMKRFGNRYNLACAYARQGKIDKAFEMLEGALEVGKGLPVEAFRAHYENINEKDPDMGPLRSNPRFSELLSRYKPPPPKTRPGVKNPHEPGGGDEPKDPHHPGGEPEMPKDPHHPGGKPEMPKDPHHPPKDGD